MWLTKKFIMEDFAAEVKQGNYKKIDYQTWRELKQLPEQWDLNVQMCTYSASETNPIFSTISWDGCNWPYEFPANDGSLGEYIRTLVEYYNTPTLSLNSSAFSNAINKVSEAAVKAGTAIRAAAQASNLAYSNNWTTTSISNNFYEKQPTVEITEQGLKVKGQYVEEIIDEVTGNSIQIRKEKDNMDLIKNFDFGSCANDRVKVSMYGIAVQNAAGTWVSYDPKTGKIIDVDILNFDGKYLYKMPVAIKDIAAGDVVIHNRKPMFVSKVEDGKILAIDPAAGEEKVIMLTTNMFGFDFATKVINLFAGFSGGATADAPFGNMLPLMLMSNGGKTDDMLPLMFMMNGGNMDMSNPMMMYFLMKDSKGGNDMLPFLMMSNLYGNKCTCNCDCDREG